MLEDSSGAARAAEGEVRSAKRKPSFSGIEIESLVWWFQLKWSHEDPTRL